MSDAKEEPKLETYPASCHCGLIRFSVTLGPGLDEVEVMDCNCSICRRLGYLLVCTLHLLSHVPERRMLRQGQIRRSPELSGKEIPGRNAAFTGSTPRRRIISFARSVVQV
jgi:hypothetical protein